MKRLSLFLFIVFILALSGCSKTGKDSEEQTTTITPTITTVETTTSTSTTTESTTTTTVSPSVDGILLDLEYVDIGKIKIMWDAVGEAPRGFRVLWSKTSGPTYPLRDGDDFLHIKKSNTKEITIMNLDNSTYYFRVCEFLEDECGVYSNEVSHTAGATTTTTP